MCLKIKRVIEKVSKSGKVLCASTQELIIHKKEGQMTRQYVLWVLTLSLDQSAGNYVFIN